ncbi:hypothetical protein GF348_07985 [candidate division KSB3 bacterium]|nr:hypothetical protein [candidate division KSB3 bacterium]
MALFLIKKAFFDLWDHLLSVVILNLGFVLVMAAGLYIPYLLNFHSLTALIGLALGGALLMLYAGAVALFVRDIADYQPVEWSRFLDYLRQMWPAAVVFSLITFLQIFIVLVAIPWYFSQGSVPGMVAMGVLFWASVFWWFASQYYFPIRSRLDSEPKKVLTKCFVMLFDNPLFTLGLGLGTLALIALSTLTAFLLPGIGGILLWHQVGFKLRLYKYDYLEQQPRGQKHRIPWPELLSEDRQRVGTRTLRGLIFPWKD